jgi:hypothetical protein
MGFWAVVWVVLMVLWLFGGCYLTWDPNRPHGIGSTLLPWVCVAILGAMVFGAISTGVVVVR